MLFSDRFEDLIATPWPLTHMNICPGGSLFFRYWIHPRKKPHEKDLPCTTCTPFLKLKIEFFNDPTRTPVHNIEYTVKGFPIKVDIKSDVTSLNVDGDKTDYIKNAEPLDIGNNLVRFLWKIAKILQISFV